MLGQELTTVAMQINTVHRADPGTRRASGAETYRAARSDVSYYLRQERGACCWAPMSADGKRLARRDPT